MIICVGDLRYIRASANPYGYIERGDWRASVFDCTSVFQQITSILMGLMFSWDNLLRYGGDTDRDGFFFSFVKLVGFAS